MGLNLVVPSYDISVGWRDLAIGAPSDALLLSLSPRRAALRPVAEVSVGLGLPLNDVVDVVVMLALAILRQALVSLVVGVGVLGDDVPGVKDSGNDAEDAEEDVNDRVGAADAALHPD